MAGYTRQSVADIINGADITAPPINAEFNQIASAFNGATGHSHDGSTGNAPKIDLTTSVSGYLPAVHGGIGGKNNFAATTNPAATDDAGDGYAPGSMWENTTTGRIFICVGNTANAAVWRELVQVVTSNKIEPIAHDQIDLGTPTVRFQDIYLSGGISASGNTSLGGTLNVTGAATLNSTLQVVGTSLLNGNVTLGDADTDNITFSGEVISAITPSTTNAYDLGTATKEWRDLYLDGTAHVDTLDVDENAGIIGNLEVTGNTTLTGTLGVTGDATVANLSATGTTTITSVDLNSGAIDGAVIGSASPAAGTFTTLNANTSLTAATADINGGTLDGVTIGGTTSAPATVTSLTATGTSTLTTVDINGGAIDGTTIGATSHTTGKFTTLQSTGAATLATVNIDGGTIDGTAIGGSATSSGAFTTVSASGGFTGDLTGDVTGNVTGNVTGAITGNVTGNLTGNVSASSGTSTFNNVTINGSLDMDANTTATITNLSTPVNNGDAASKLYVDTAINDLIGGAPATLDTLNEIAASLNDDANLYGTLTASIATKLPLAGGTMSGAIAMGTNKITGAGDPTAAQDVSTKNYTDNQDALQLSLTGGTMSGAIAMGSNNITGLAAPTANDHATNKLYVDNILGSATVAATSATNAATSEANAATSETNAANSATAAASSSASAAASLDSFDDRYLGAKATAPTVDNDGDALIIGALYFDTTTDTMKVYGSSGWVNAGSSVNGTSDRQTYTATAGQTVFAATYDAGYVDVYLNGVKLLAGTDFTATNGTSITLASGAAVNDIVDIVAYGTFVLADHLTETQSDAKYVELAGDTMTGDLTIGGNATVGTNTAGILNVKGGSSTSPQVRFFDGGTGRARIGVPTGQTYLSLSGSDTLTADAAIDASGNFLVGKTSPSSTSTGAELRPTGQAILVADGTNPILMNRQTSDGAIAVFRKDGTTVGSIGSENSHFVMGSSDTGIKFHSGVDAIIPHDTDGATNRDAAIDLGYSSGGKFRDLHLSRRLHTSFVNVDDNTSTGVYFTGGSNNRRQLQFSSFDTASLDAGHEIKASSVSGRLLFTTSTTTHLTLDAVSSSSVFNESGADQDFRVESDGNNAALYVDAGNNRVGILNSSPDFALDVGPTNAAGGDGIQINATRNATLRFLGNDTSMQANEVTGRIEWYTSDTNAPGIHAQILTRATNTNASGEMQIWSGTAGSINKNVHFRGDQAVFNEDSNDMDFRIESNTNTHALHVDGATGDVLVGWSGGQFNDPGYNSVGGISLRGSDNKPTIICSKALNDSPSNFYSYRYDDGSGQTADRNHISFNDSRGGSGTISSNSSGVTYNTTSDRRLKTDIQPIADGTEKLMAMNPVTHKWKADPHTGETVHGFIAQEMQEIIPEAVSGDPDGEEMMSMDYGRITPVLVAALQDAHKKIEALEERLAELEAK